MIASGVDCYCLGIYIRPMRNDVKRKSTRRKPKSPGRPREYDQTITVNVTNGWLRKVDKAAKRAGEDRSAFLRDAGEERADVELGVRPQISEAE